MRIRAKTATCTYFAGNRCHSRFLKDHSGALPLSSVDKSYARKKKKAMRVQAGLTYAQVLRTPPRVIIEDWQLDIWFYSQRANRRQTKRSSKYIHTHKKRVDDEDAEPPGFQQWCLERANTR